MAKLVNFLPTVTKYTKAATFRRKNFPWFLISESGVCHLDEDMEELMALKMCG